ncbi:3'-5' exonuclease [Sporobolomyces salmoneus]|uniref:3'-5' exonuclease n=1 Tax=Sporobolomyces salmoneus TaxID=183962 RepID=UPI0031767888
MQSCRRLAVSRPPHRPHHSLKATTTPPRHVPGCAAIKSWTPGDPIRFNDKEGEGRAGGAGEWKPGQPIKFAQEDKARVQTLMRKSPSPRLNVSRRSRLSSPIATTSRATLSTTSPNSSFEVSGETSWNLSNRWEPPSFASTAGQGDLSGGSTAVFDHDRSYAKVGTETRALQGVTGAGERKTRGIRDIQEGKKVDVAVQTDSPTIKRQLVEAPSQAELDQLVQGVNFDDFEDSSDFESTSLPLPAPLPSTSTPPQPRSTRKVQLSQPEVEDLLAGIDFSQDLEMSDFEEQDEEESFHSASSSLVIVSSTTPNLLHSSQNRISSPRIIVRKTPRTVATVPPSPPPVLPAQPDVFTLSSTPPAASPHHWSPIPHFASSSKNRKPSSPSTIVLSSSSPPRLSASTSTSIYPQIRFHSTSTSQPKNGNLKELKNSRADWDSVVESIELSAEEDGGEDSVEIIEFTQKSSKTTKTMATGTGRKEDLKGKGKAREREEKENKPPPASSSSATAPRPGYFVRPASMQQQQPSSAPLSVSTSHLNRTTSQPLRKPQPTKPSTSTSLSHSRPREPQRESFKGRNSEDRYKSALKQYQLQQKWPIQFDYTTWSTSSVNGKKRKGPRVVFTTDERVVEETLKTLSGPTGFDLEWNAYEVKSRGQGRTALVQICDQETILLVQVAKMKNDQRTVGFPRSLKEFIEDPKKIKLGVQIAGDARKLTRDFNHQPRGLLELNDLTKRYDPSRHIGRTGPLIGLQDLVGMYLDTYLPKERKVRCGVWSGDLTEEQKIYGANDVYSSLQVLRALQSLIESSTGSPLDLYEFTTPRLTPLSPSSAAPTRSYPRPVVFPSSTSITDSPKSILDSLPPRKLESYTLFQSSKLSLPEIATRMSQTNSIKQTSVLWNLLGLYSSTREETTIEWDEERLVEAVEGIGGLWTGRMREEHEGTVNKLREKIASNRE